MVGEEEEEEGKNGEGMGVKRFIYLFPPVPYLCTYTILIALWQLSWEPV